MKNRDFLYSAHSPKGVVEPSNGVYRSCGPNCPSMVEDAYFKAYAQVLLDLPVRTDTKGVGRGLKGDPMVPIRCDACGLPLNKCQCIAGIDY